MLLSAHMDSLIGPLELEFLAAIALSLIIGITIGIERELRNKDAGISTHVLVILGAALFTLLSANVDPTSTSRISAQIVTGIGFLGAGLILKDGFSVRNLTTAASLWVAAAIGMAIGYGFYMIAIMAGIISAVAPRLPDVHKHPRD